MSEQVEDGFANEIDKKLEASKESARERIKKVVEKFRDEPNLKITVEDENPEVTVLNLEVINEENGESKKYRKFFMNVPVLPGKTPIEEEVERQIRFPEGNIGEAIEKINRIED